MYIVLRAFWLAYQTKIVFCFSPRAKQWSPCASFPLVVTQSEHKITLEGWLFTCMLCNKTAFPSMSVNSGGYGLLSTSYPLFSFASRPPSRSLRLPRFSPGCLVTVPAPNTKEAVSFSLSSFRKPASLRVHLYF